MALTVAAIPHATAIIAAINGAGGHAYLVDDLKRLAALPEHFTEVHVMARVDENERIGSLGGIVPARVMTRHVARTQRNAEAERAKTETALLGKTITVAGEVFGPMRRDATDDPVDDAGDGWWAGTSSWVYA